MKERLETVVRFVQRDGIEDLLKFAAESDFYTAPCSTKFHLNIPGGLAQHTMNVIDCALGINKRYKEIYLMDSIIISAFCHDLCKINFYTFDNEPPTDPQITFLRSLCIKAGIKVPEKLTKSYVSICIEHLKSMKKLPLPEFTISYKVDDQLPLGHGEKSLYIAQKFLKLTDEEAMAIRWHMGAWDLPSSAHPYNAAIEKSKLVAILILADMEASTLMEV